MGFVSWTIARLFFNVSLLYGLYIVIFAAVDLGAAGTLFRTAGSLTPRKIVSWVGLDLKISQG